MANLAAFQFSFNSSQGLRPAKLVDFISKDMPLVDCLDGKKPARVTLQSNEFPWARYLVYLQNAWLHSNSIPNSFRLKKRLSPELSLAMQNPQLNDSDSYIILKAMRSAGFFPY